MSKTGLADVETSIHRPDLPKGHAIEPESRRRRGRHVATSAFSFRTISKSENARAR